MNHKVRVRGELDTISSHAISKTITVALDDEGAWFRAHPQWSKTNKYAELEIRIYT